MSDDPEQKHKNIKSAGRTDRICKLKEKAVDAIIEKLLAKEQEERLQAKAPKVKPRKKYG